MPLVFPKKIKSITLCITNYNKERFLDRAIISCQSQVQENFNIADCLAAGGDYESCK